MKLLLKILLIAIGLFVVITAGMVALYKWLPVKVTPLMVLRAKQHPDEAAFVDWHHRWVPLDSISPYLPVAVIASEDQNFISHDGFDFTAIRAAAAERLEGGRQRGGSTISQQTAKNVFLWPASSWLRKGLEAYFTVLIETFWSKERIMEVYLNSIEMGKGIYGVAAVAEQHFGCAPAALGRSECALIAATLPNPLRYDSQHPSAYMRRRQQRIKREMRHIPFMPRENAEAEKAEKPSNKGKNKE